jgi:hypothetical protein
MRVTSYSLTFKRKRRRYWRRRRKERNLLV